MKNLNLLLGLGLMATAMSAQAQTVVAQLGFENGDPKGKSSQYALTPGKSQYGDWVNVYGDWVNPSNTDVWNEAFADDVHSGEYALCADNGAEAFEADGTSVAFQTWHRAFKIANIPVKPATAYRVSFWVKGPSDGRLSTWLSKGVENFEKNILTVGGQSYGRAMAAGELTGEWQHVSFVSFYSNPESLDSIVATQSWVGNAVFPESFGGDGTKTYSEYFEKKLPEEYFFIANMCDPGRYILDDIKVEEGVTFNEATYVADVIKLDFGYATNIGALARAEAAGTFVLDPSCVSVTVNGQGMEVASVEGKTDGFLYIFLDGEISGDDADVKVSFTPAADCPILYDKDKRPSIDLSGDMQVLGFQNETAYFDDRIDALPLAWSPAKVVNVVPENNSFELAANFGLISVTYDKALDITTASASVIKNGQQTDLTGGMNLSEDKKTVNITVPTLADGEYDFILAGVANEMGVACESDAKISFSVGADNDQTKSEVIFNTDSTFAIAANGTFPTGWVANDNGTIHQYGLTDLGEVWNYNWGGNVGGGGCRSMTGYSGDLNGAAIYWRTMNGENKLGTLTYGEQVKDYMLEDGTLDPEMPEDIALWLDAKKHQLTIRMCAWKNLNGNTDAVNEENAPLYTFTLEDLDGNVYAEFKDVKAMPNVNGAQNMAVNNVTKSQTDFTVDKPGYYVLKFATTQANAELLMGGVDIITMPSKAAYYKQQLKEAADAAKSALAQAEGADYDGDTKTALTNAIATAEAGGYHSPSEVTAACKNMQDLAAKLLTRVKNIDGYNEAILSAVAAIEALEGKYAESQYAKDAKVLVGQYQEVNPTTLSDEELAEVAPKLAVIKDLLVPAEGQAQSGLVRSVDALTWRGYKAWQTAGTLKVTDEAAMAAAINMTDDNDEVVDALNNINKIALYKLLAASNGVIADTLKTTVNYDGSAKIVEGDEYVDSNAEAVCASGIDFASLVKNPKFYTYATDFGANIESNTVVGWEVEKYDGYGLHLNGTAASQACPVVNANINAYSAGAAYKFYQVIENAPVGVYDVYFGTRTALKNQADENGVVGAFNAMNEETLIWDKYIFAQVDEGEILMTPFSAGSNWGGHPTAIHNVTVKEGQKLTIGIVENYTSGKASGHDYSATSAWDTNTTAGDARLYFVAPLDGYDYAAAANTLETSIEAAPATAAATVVGIYSVSGAEQKALQKGINIVKFSNGDVKKVLVK